MQIFPAAPAQISHQDARDDTHAHARHMKGGESDGGGGGVGFRVTHTSMITPPRPNQTQTEDISFGFYPHSLHILGNLPSRRQHGCTSVPADGGSGGVPPSAAVPVTARDGSQPR